MQILSGWDTLQCMALVMASRRGDATAKGHSKRWTVETIKNFYINKIQCIYILQYIII